MIPILRNHDMTKVIGKCEPFEGNSFLITFFDLAITKEQFTNAINCGFTILDSRFSDGNEYIKKARIFEISCIF